MENAPEQSAQPLRFPLAALSQRLALLTTPLSAAFVSRWRALDRAHAKKNDATNAATDDEVLAILSDLTYCLTVSQDIDAMVVHAAECVRRIGAASESRTAYRSAAQAFDWAIRDLLLDQYTALQRREFVQSTDLFVDLVRRLPMLGDTIGASAAPQRPDG